MGSSAASPSKFPLRCRRHGVRPGAQDAAAGGLGELHSHANASAAAVTGGADAEASADAEAFKAQHTALSHEVCMGWHTHLHF